MLHLERGNGFETIPMQQIATNLYEAEFPPSDCGIVTQYYLSIEKVGGGQFSDPFNAPVSNFSAIIANQSSTQFVDDFETDQGRTVSGDATNGHWERGVPAAGGDQGDPYADGDGSGKCFVTDNADGDADVDNGETVLTSPLLNVSHSGSQEAIVSYYRWLANDEEGPNGGDELLVEISNIDGVDWISLETVPATGSGGRVFRSFRISEFVQATSQMRVRFVVSDTADDSVIEAGLDAVRIQIVDCDPGCRLGDVNGDGMFDLLDVSPFVSLLTTNGFQCEADLNFDGSVDLLDISPFVQLLLGN